MQRQTAIIIEPRKHKALHFVLKNALDSLPDHWDILLFHGTQNVSFIKGIQTALLQEYPNRSLQSIGLSVENLNQKTYSELLATRSIIYDAISTEYFLVFQTDSMFFKEHIYLLQTFIEEDYDYVGAPWRQTNYYPTKVRDFIGNGGFSLRKTKTMLEIIQKHDWYAKQASEFEWLEDLYFTAPYSNVLVKKPSYDKAKTFCVDEVFSDYSVGCHRVWVHAHFAELCRLYPDLIVLESLQGVFP